MFYSELDFAKLLVKAKKMKLNKKYGNIKAFAHPVEHYSKTAPQSNSLVILHEQQEAKIQEVEISSKCIHQITVRQSQRHGQ